MRKVFIHSVKNYSPIKSIQKKPKSQRSAVRSLKIQPKFRINEYSTKVVPEIKLCGNWLEKLGFFPEQRVKIISKEKEIIIQLEDDDIKL